MSFAVTNVSEHEATLALGGDPRATFKKDRTMVLPVSPTPEHDPKAAATMESLALYGGMPRFHAWVSTGRPGIAIPGNIESSGQHTLDLKFPTMRVDVMATQFYCTEAEWQADAYKRLTHWSLGDGVSWMRPPDKNCVQPGSVEGGFYASGVGSESALLGTAVLDTLQGHAHEVYASLSVVSNTSSGQVPMNNGAQVKTNILAKTIISDGVNGDPRVAAITKPRTWYGIWMVRMYGRVTNAGDLNAPALNARMDMIDARVSGLEGRMRTFGDKQEWAVVTASVGAEVYYQNASNRTMRLSVVGTAIVNNARVSIDTRPTVDGTVFSEAIAFANANASAIVTADVMPGHFYKVRWASSDMTINVIRRTRDVVM